MAEINTHNLIISFGKHKGERWTRLPISYLKWILNQHDMAEAIKQTAKAELARRGTVLSYDLELSGHAIDRASLYCLRHWKDTRKENEGIHAWLLRVAYDALAHGKKIDDHTFQHKFLKFGFAFGELYPTLKTIIPVK